MDLLSWIALGGLTLLNVSGWVYTKIYTYGRLEQKVKDLDKDINDGLIDKVDKMGNHVAKLEGTINTYMELTKK